VTREADTAGTERQKKIATANVSEQFSSIRFIRYCDRSIVAPILCGVEWWYGEDHEGGWIDGITLGCCSIPYSGVLYSHQRTDIP
jgi:hypothetical protein